MKTKEELNALKEEVETVSRKRHVLTEKELDQVTGGINSPPNRKGDIIVFKIDAPVIEEDVVEIDT